MTPPFNPQAFGFTHIIRQHELSNEIIILTGIKAKTPKPDSKVYITAFRKTDHGWFACGALKKPAGFSHHKVEIYMSSTAGDLSTILGEERAYSLFETILLELQQ